jgi:phasin protein
METKSKRTGRNTAPLKSPIPRTAPAEAPVQIRPSEVKEAALAAVPNPLDEVVQPVSPAVPAVVSSRSERADLRSEAFSAIEESRTAITRGLNALSEEMAGLARCGIDTAAHTAIEMLAVKTLSDAIAVNAGFARSSFDNWIDGSAKFSELGIKLAIESSRPFLACLGKS